MRYLKRSKYQTGFTLVEMIVVLVVCGLLLYVGTRSVSTYIDRERFRKTVQEMDEIKKAYFGDERVVTLGRRVDFGYWGTSPTWLANAAALASLEPFMNVEAARSAEITTDAWGTAYTVTSAAGTWTLTSLGSGGALGGIEEAADISLVIDKDDWQNNLVAIYVQDSQGVTLLGADDSEPPYLRYGHLAIVTFNEHGGGSLTWHKNSAGLTFTNGYFYGSGINAGPCSVEVTIADDTGGGAAGNPYYGDYDWRNQLTGGASTFTQEFVIYPIGDSGKPNVLIVKLPGAVLKGINELP
ncbi:MAG: prepilin-type N-terminal cleavage/methylation domain-containing protein [Candidatus Omnitrophica bacterium]|nr:prepilin-type N-terminal cleavage/methylation domain-containing protein [Candidatus Omnitrophota bacterium]